MCFLAVFAWNEFQALRYVRKFFPIFLRNFYFGGCPSRSSQYRGYFKIILEIFKSTLEFFKHPFKHKIDQISTWMSCQFGSLENWVSSPKRVDFMTFWSLWIQDKINLRVDDGNLRFKRFWEKEQSKMGVSKCIIMQWFWEMGGVWPWETN